LEEKKKGREMIKEEGNKHIRRKKAELKKGREEKSKSVRMRKKDTHL
jgi:hypothetical protein